MYKGIIFDLDGVICFTDQYHYQAWKKLTDRLNIEFDEEINDRLRGISRLDSLDIILENSKKKYSIEQKEKLAEEKNEIYKELLAEMSTDDLPQESLKILKELKERGYKLAIGSSSKNTKMILKQLGLQDFFDAVSDGTNITHSKPNPEVFLKAANMLKENPEDCLVIEDAKSGAEAAYRGHFHCAGLGKACEDPHITYQLYNLSDLLNIL